jgi:hypothetical protein
VFPELLGLLKDHSIRETLDGLRKVGFRVNTGIEGTGFLLLVWSKASGYYFGAYSHSAPHFHPVTECYIEREAQMSARAS